MDKKNEKKFIQSPIAVICYILAALMLIYACFQAGSTVKQINEYYSSYGMSAKASEYVTYVLQAILDPLIHAFTFFIAGYILNAVRKLDPKNYKTVEELVEIEEAKKEAKEQKQAAKGEVKAAKSEAKAAKAGFTASKEESVRADFSESLEAELKSDAKAADGVKKKSGQSRSRNSQNKNGSKSSSSKSGGRSGENKSGSGKSGENKPVSGKSGENKSGAGKKSTGRKTETKKEEVKEALTEAYNNKVEESSAKTDNKFEEADRKSVV